MLCSTDRQGRKNQKKYSKFKLWHVQAAKHISEIGTKSNRFNFDLENFPNESCYRKLFPKALIWFLYYLGVLTSTSREKVYFPGLTRACDPYDIKPFCINLLTHFRIQWVSIRLSRIPERPWFGEFEVPSRINLFNMLPYYLFLPVGMSYIFAK